jgi:hypothetical protein
MPIKTPTLISLFLSLFLALILGACSGSADDGSPAPVQEEPTAQESGEDLPADSSLDSEAGTDLEGVNACQQIPAEEVSAIVGPLREDETREDVSISGEAGCTYYDQDGHFYDLSFEPLYSWGTVEYALNEAEPVEGLLDGAWQGTYEGGEITVKALVEGELVIGVHLSSGGIETARDLVMLANQYRP